MAISIPDISRWNFRISLDRFKTVTFPYIIIYLAPFIDMLNGYVQNIMRLSSPIGQLFRGLIILYTFRYIYNPKAPLFSSLSILALVLYAFAVPIWLLSEPVFYFGTDITYFIRIIYYLSVVSYFWKFRNEFNLRLLSKFMNNAAIISALSLVFCLITGMGVQTYEVFDVKIGTRGFFTAGNDVGLFMNICLIATIVNLKYYNTFRQIIIIFLTFCANIAISTRVGIVGSAIIMLIFFYQLMTKRLPGMKIKKGLMAFTKILLLVSVASVTVVLIDFIQNNDYLLNRFNFDNPVNSRALLLDAGNKAIEDMDGQQYIIGRSYSGSMFNIAINIGRGVYENNQKAVEAEFHDTISAYGYVLGGIIILLFLIPVIYGIKLYLRKKTFLRFWNVIGLVLFTGIAYNAGHAYTNAMVFPMMSVIFIMALYSDNTTSCRNEK